MIRCLPLINTGAEGDLLLNREGQIYLAACSHSPFSKLHRNALESYQRDLAEFGNPWDMWVEKIEKSVKLFATLIHASPEEVFPSFSVSSALSTVMSSFKYGRRNRLVLSDLEYPTTNFIFLAQQKHGARVSTLRNRKYALSADAYSKSISDRTLLTSAIHVSSLNGFRQDIGEIAAMAHERGSLFYTDVYQSLGTIPVDVRKIDADFLACGNLKYLLGLPGIAFMYVRRELARRLEPTSIGWFSQKDPFLFGAKRLDFQDTARRFESGTLSIPSVYAAIEGMRAIIDIGAGRIERHISRLTQRALDIAHDTGIQTITPLERGARGAIVSFVVRRPHELEGRLRSMGVITSSRGIGLRIAPHFYNTDAEIDRAVEVIGSMRDT